MRILHLAASHRWTGVAEPATRLARGEAAAGHDVLLAVTPGASFARRAAAFGVAVDGSIAFDRSRWFHRRVLDYFAFKRLVRRFRPDVVHAHLTHDHLLAALALPGGRRPLLVRTFHRETPPRTDGFTRGVVMGRTQGALAVSGALASQLGAAFDVPPERLLTIGGVFDDACFTPDPAAGRRMRDLWGIAAEAPVLGIVSRIRVARGFAWLLDAAALALPPRSQARLVICGRGNWDEELRERLKDNPAGDRIIHAGYVSGADLEDSYRAFDAALLLKPGNDGACRGALEAMGCGKPVIGGDIGAMHDLLAGGTRGWLVPEDDHTALAAAMGEALDSPVRCAELGAEARRHALAHHTEAALARRVLGFYEGLLGGSGG